MEMIRHEGGQIGSKLDQQLRLVARGRQSEFAASGNQPLYEFAADVLALAGPARDGSDEHVSEPPHDLSGVFVARLALFEDGAQVGVIDVRESPRRTAYASRRNTSRASAANATRPRGGAL